VNTPTAIGTYVFGFLIVVAIGVVIRRMLSGWKHRSQMQEELIGTLPAMPDMPGPAIVAPTRGLYLGCTIAESDALRASGSSADWLNRVTTGDLGYRSKAVLTRYRAGILLERSGTGPIWIPQDSIVGVRTERGMAGKVLPAARTGSNAAGLLVIRWRLPSGTEIDTGFRGDDRRDYSQWLGDQE
jgi:hypothetical protein